MVIFRETYNRFPKLRKIFANGSPGFATVLLLEGSTFATILVQPVFIHKHPARQPAGHSWWSVFFIYSPFLFFFLVLYFFLIRFFIPQAGRRFTQDKHAGETRVVCVRHVGAVPSSVVALSAGWQGGCRPRRKRGPRGTRRRTPRWFHAVKAVRFLQQLRIAAPPTTDIHIRAIRHPSGGETVRRPVMRKKGIEKEKERKRRKLACRPGWIEMLETETTTAWGSSLSGKRKRMGRVGFQVSGVYSPE